MHSWHAQAVKHMMQAHSQHNNWISNGWISYDWVRKNRARTMGNLALKEAFFFELLQANTNFVELYFS
jgi:hypothetical protein